MKEKIYLKSTLGAGLFAEIKNILRTIYVCQFEKEILIDFSQEFFPYKNNNNNLCEFNNILTIKKNIKLDEDLIIYNKNNTLNYNLFDYDRELIDDNKYDTRTCIIMFRRLNNVNKLNYLKKINRIINQFIQIDKKLLEESDNFCKKYQKNYILGIHYRASCGHNCELKDTKEINFHLKINKIFQKIDKIRVEKNIDVSNFKIYLATDVESIRTKFISKYRENLIYNINNKYMSKTPKDEHEPHFGFSLHHQHNLQNLNFIDFFHKNKPGLDGGIQLMIDCLNLSKCNFFIPSNSNLSDFVLMLNPEIEYSYF